MLATSGPPTVLPLSVSLIEPLIQHRAVRGIRNFPHVLLLPFKLAGLLLVPLLLVMYLYWRRLDKLPAVCVPRWGDAGSGCGGGAWLGWEHRTGRQGRSACACE